MTPDQFIGAARGMIGTPWHHQGRVPGVGLDCIGLIVCAARACGVELPDRQGYSREPHGVIRPALEAHCGGRVADPRPGDIALFSIVREPQHVGILTEFGMLHAYLTSGRVIEHGLDARWRRRLVAVYRLPELKA